MEMVRNFINVKGITPEEGLPKEVKGHAILYSDIENLFIPEDQPAASGLFEVEIKVEILSNRTIKTSLGQIVVIDGIRIFKIIYTQNQSNGNAVFLTLKVPYNTFVELPKGKEQVEDISLYIGDAYFHMVDNRTIYCYTLYLIDVHYNDTMVMETPAHRMIPQTTHELLTENIIEDQATKSEKIKDQYDHLIDIDSEYL